MTQVTPERVCPAVMTFIRQFWILVASQAFVGAQAGMENLLNARGDEDGSDLDDG